MEYVQESIKSEITCIDSLHSCGRYFRVGLYEGQESDVELLCGSVIVEKFQHL